MQHIKHHARFQSTTMKYYPRRLSIVSSDIIERSVTERTAWTSTSKTHICLHLVKKRRKNAKAVSIVQNHGTFMNIKRAFIFPMEQMDRQTGDLNMNFQPRATTGHFLLRGRSCGQMASGRGLGLLFIPKTAFKTYKLKWCKPHYRNFEFVL